MPPIKDLTGQQFGMLVAIEPTAERKDRSVIWRCKCACGKEILASAKLLKSGDKTTCGCRRRGVEKMNLNLRNNEMREGTVLCQLSRKKTNKNSTSQHRGVSFETRTQSWAAYIFLKGVKYHLGRFKEKKSAIAARKRAEEKYFEPVLNKYGRTLYKEDLEDGKQTS